MIRMTDEPSPEDTAKSLSTISVIFQCSLFFFISLYTLYALHPMFNCTNDPFLKHKHISRKGGELHCH